MLSLNGLALAMPAIFFSMAAVGEGRAYRCNCPTLSNTSHAGLQLPLQRFSSETELSTFPNSTAASTMRAMQRHLSV